MELAPTFTDVNTVEAVVRELDEDALPLVARVAAEGITHPVLFVTRFVELESLERLRARQTMLEDVGQGAAVVIYPLPPYLADLLRPVLRRELTFDSGPIAQVHFQHDAIQGLSYDKLLLLTSMPAGVTSLVLDGQRRGKVLTVRANAASVLELIARNSLQRVFLHRIPHVPRGEQFVTLDVTNKAVEILDV